MKAKNELEYLAMIAQDYISKQDRSVQIAMAERAQHCVNVIEGALNELDVLSQPAPEEKKATTP